MSFPSASRSRTYAGSPSTPTCAPRTMRRSSGMEPITSIRSDLKYFVSRH